MFIYRVKQADLSSGVFYPGLSHKQKTDTAGLARQIWDLNCSIKLLPLPSGIILKMCSCYCAQ